MSEKGHDIAFKDLFRDVQFHEEDVRANITVPDSFYQRFTDFFMERSYLNDAGDRQFAKLPTRHGKITWLRVTHLPVHPGNAEDYDLLSRWQGVLSTLHAWNYRLMFLLLRKDGETSLYLGTASFTQDVDAKEAIEQIREAASGSMPGIGLTHIPGGEQVYHEIMLPLSQLPTMGAVTGIPSFRGKDRINMLQTLDSLAFGTRDQDGIDRNYAMLVIADPLPDAEVAQLIGRHRELGSRIHTAVSRTVNDSKSISDNKQKGLGGYGGAAVGDVLGTLMTAALGVIPGVNVVAPFVGGLVKAGVAGVAASTSKQITLSASSSVSTQLLDKYAEYSEQLLDKHIARLNEGRNLGFWNTGVYVMGTARDVRTVTGMLRSIYSGQESYLEPIRTHMLRDDSGAKNIVSLCFDLIPLVDKQAFDQLEREKRGLEAERSEWHVLGRPYQYLSTPINTAELSLATSLPRRDVPGLRFVKTAIRFANNPAPVSGDAIHMGQVVDMGVEQSTPYLFNPNVLVRHAFVTGITGSGKSTTCQHLLKEALARDIPTLVIEPAKDDYVRWALEMNQTLPPEKRIRVFMPGGENLYPGVEPLHLNLFEPAAIRGAKVDLLQHSESLSMLINACLPSEEVVPILIDETVYATVCSLVEDEEEAGYCDPLDAYPNVNCLIDAARQVMDHKSYEPRVAENLKEILLTRFQYLKRGTRGSVFNVLKSTDYDQLFSRPAVVNISRLAGSKEKSLVMSMLLLSLYEYRASAYQYDAEYRAQAEKNKLMHLTLVEEAHNVLAAPPAQNAYGDPRQAAADLFSNMISEIRKYGEGLIVVDQTPVKLIPDVIKNTNLKICHRLVAPDDCEMIAATLALRPDQRSIIPALEVGNAIICGDMDDAAAWVKMPAPARKGGRGK